MPYNPQKNGLEEINNRSIMYAVREMIHDQDLPMHLWEEATRTAIYVFLEKKTQKKCLLVKTPK